MLTRSAFDDDDAGANDDAVADANDEAIYGVCVFTTIDLAPFARCARTNGCKTASTCGVDVASCRASQTCDEDFAYRTMRILVRRLLGTLGVRLLIAQIQTKCESGQCVEYVVLFWFGTERD